MTEVVEFLLARIAEDEADAGKATPGHWKLWAMQVLADTGGNNEYSEATPVADTHSVDQGSLRTFNANHIARWNPARVLAECEAKRLRLALHKGCDASCYVLRVEALPYADHAAWREEWRP